MKKLLILLLPLVLIGTSCKKIDALDGEQLEFEVNVSNFDGIDLQGVGSLVYTHDTTHSITVVTTQKVYDEMQFTVSGSTLVIKFRDNVTIENGDQVKIYISHPGVKNFTLSGSGSITADLDSNQISGGLFHISGSGSLYATNIVHNGTIDAKISGSGNMALEGISDGSDVLLSGSGTIANFNLHTDNTEVRLTGSGRVECRVNNALDVLISGSGNVYYKGNPTITQAISGSGSLIDAN